MNRLPLLAASLLVSQIIHTEAQTPKATLREAPMRRYPGAAPRAEVRNDPDWKNALQGIGINGKLAADCNSPSFWRNGTFYLFNSWDHPWRSTGPNLESVLHKDNNGDGIFEVNTPVSEEVIVDSDTDSYQGVYGTAANGDPHHPEPGGGKGGLYDFNGGRHLEGVWLNPANGRLYGWYHNETDFHDDQLDFGNRYPCLALIGQMYSDDNGKNWIDQGIVITPETGSVVLDQRPGIAQNQNGGAGWPPPNLDYLDTWQHYYVGGIGDFGTCPDKDNRYLYFFTVTFNKNDAKDGFCIYRLDLKNGDITNPIGKIRGWKNGGWNAAWNEAPDPIASFNQPNGQPGQANGHGWMDKFCRGFWNPCIHWNTHLNMYVMVVHRLKANSLDADDGSRDTGSWVGEGIYVSYNKDIANPEGWTVPVKILDRTAMFTEDTNVWYVTVNGTGPGETDNLVGKEGRLFVQGRSKWFIDFGWEEEEDLTIDFENLGIATDFPIPQGAYDLPGKLDVQFRGVSSSGSLVSGGTNALKFWGGRDDDGDGMAENYAQLRNVAYAYSSSSLALRFAEIALVPQPGYSVTLHSFDLAAFDASNDLDLDDHREDVTVQVIDDKAGALYNKSHHDIDGDPGNAPRRFYDGRTSIKPIRIRFDALNGFIGVDNIRVSVQPVTPEVKIRENTANGALLLDFPTVLGMRYGIHYTSSLDQAFSLATTLDGNGRPVTWQDDGTFTLTPPDTQSQRFYKIEQSVIP